MPMLCDRNSTASVILKVFMQRPMAASQHAVPCLVFSGSTFICHLQCPQLCVEQLIPTGIISGSS
jgi:hypothetical protein